MVGRTVDSLRHRRRTEVEQQADPEVAEPQVCRELTIVDGGDGLHRFDLDELGAADNGVGNVRGIDSDVLIDQWQAHRSFHHEPSASFEDGATNSSSASPLLGDLRDKSGSEGSVTANAPNSRVLWPLCYDAHPSGRAGRSAATAA